MKAHAHVDSFARTRLASSWSPLQSKLRVVVWQNARRDHTELKDLQPGILLYVLDEFISESSRIRFAFDRNLPCRLVVCSDTHIGGWQTLENVLQNFDRVIARIDSRRQRLPILLRGANKLRLRRVPHYAPIQASNREAHEAEVCQQKKEERGVSAACPNEPLSPFRLLG